MRCYLSDGRNVEIRWRHRHPLATECRVTVEGRTVMGLYAMAAFNRPALRKRSLARALLRVTSLTKEDRRDIWEDLRAETRGSWGRPLLSQDWGRAYWSKPSRAIVACRNGAGCVLYHKGAAIECQIDGVGSVRLDNLSLDDAPEGLSVWEGTYRTVSFTCDYGTDYDTEAEGTFRPLSREEWAAVQRGESPW